MSNQDFDSGSSGGLSSITDGLTGGDGFTETTSRSWFQRILDSLKGIVIGLILVLCSCVLIFWNEGRSAKTAAALAEGAGLVISVPSEKIDPAFDGKLVHLAGNTSAVQPARDSDFGIDAKGLKLTRKVEMYQWKEERHSETQKKLGGGEETVTRYTYNKEWSDSAVDSTRFRNSADHRNPQMPNIASRSFAAPDAKLGAFALNDRITQMLSSDDTFDVPETAQGQARTRLGQRARVQQGQIYAGADPDKPAVGDVRVTYHYLPLTPVSVVARQTQSTLAPYIARNGQELLLAEKGIKDAASLFKDSQDENRILTWILRAVGALLMFIGFRLMLSLLEILADVVPFFGNIVGAGASLVALLCTFTLAPLIAAIAWFFYRPVVAIGVLVVGAAVVFGLRLLAHNRTAAKAGNLQPQTALRLPGSAP